jgi:hypothetical protein
LLAYRISKKMSNNNNNRVDMLLQCVETFYYAASGSERPLVIDGMVCLLDVDVTKCRIGPAASCTYSIRKMVSTIGSIVCSCCGHRRLVRRHIRR